MRLVVLLGLLLVAACAERGQGDVAGPYVGGATGVTIGGNAQAFYGRVSR
jgi:hypothetical protein